MEEKKWRSGFIVLLGYPNSGKSSLLNRLIEEPHFSIVTNKAQTTQSRILGIRNGSDYQAIFVDTPGLLSPKDALHEYMLSEIGRACSGADIVLWVLDSTRGVEMSSRERSYMEDIGRSSIPCIRVLNKIDKLPKGLDKGISGSVGLEAETPWSWVSARRGWGIDTLWSKIYDRLPFHPPYYPLDQLSDRNDRFLMAEIIRKHIFLLYDKEIPYSCAVLLRSFEEGEKLVRMESIIYTERDSQKGILIGRQGRALTQLGKLARQDMERFLSKRVYLAIRVKVQPLWKREKRGLKRVGIGN
ncbi:MAG: GTPase Era [Cytophagales bacterium]|nr:GTPase Era [Cytophagales bacterium]